MDLGPRVRLLREHGVCVEDVGLYRQDDGDDNECNGKETQEAGASEPGCGRREDSGEVAAVFAQAVDCKKGVISGREAEEDRPDKD